MTNHIINHNTYHHILKYIQQQLNQNNTCPPHNQQTPTDPPQNWTQITNTEPTTQNHLFGPDPTTITHTLNIHHHNHQILNITHNTQNHTLNTHLHTWPLQDPNSIQNITTYTQQVINTYNKHCPGPTTCNQINKPVLGPKTNYPQPHQTSNE